MSTGEGNVQISISVVDAGSTATIQKVRTEMVGLDAGTRSLSASAGLAGTQIEQMNGALRNTASAAGTAETAMDGLRGRTELARFAFEEFGVRAPRYLSRLMADSEALMGVMSAMSGIFVGMAAISMFGMAIKEAKDFYHANLDVNASLDDYRKKAAEAASHKLFDTASLETTRAALSDINRQLSQIDKMRAEDARQGYHADPNRPGSVIVSDRFEQKGVNDREAALLPLRDSFNDRAADQQTEQRKKQIENDKQYFDLTHQGYAKIAGDRKYDLQLSNMQFEADRKKALLEWTQINNLRAQQDTENKIPPNQRQYVPPIPTDAGVSDKNQRDQEINQRAQGEGSDITRQNTEEEIALRNEATNAALRGDSLLFAQRSQHEEEIQRKISQGKISQEMGMREIADVELKYQNERMKRLEDYQRETDKIARDHQAAGLTGGAKIAAEGSARVNDILADAQRQGAGLDFDVAAFKRAQDEKKSTNAQMLKDQQDFTERVNQLADSSADHQVSGFARIRDEQQKLLASLKKDYKAHTAGLTDSDQLAKYSSDFQRGVGIINGSADRQSSALQQQTDDQTLKLEEEARRKSLTGEAQKTQQIVDEYNERTRAYQREMDEQRKATNLTEVEKQNITDTYNRRAAAAYKEMNAEMQQDAEATRDKLAGELEGLFKNPSRWMQGLGDKAMSTAAASFLMQVPGMDQVAGGKGGLTGAITSGSWMRNLMGGSPHGQGSTQQAGFRWPWERNASASAHVSGIAAPAASSTLSMASAAISIGSANISVGGGAGSAPGTAGSTAGSISIPSASGSVGTGGVAPTSGTQSVTALGTSTPGYSTPDSTASSTNHALGTVGASMPRFSGAAGHGGFGGVINDVRSGVNYARQGIGLMHTAGLTLPSSLGGTGTGTSASAPAASGIAGTNGAAGEAPDVGNYEAPLNKSVGELAAAPQAAGLPKNYAGAASGAIGLYGAYESTGGVGGALGGAMSGAELGTAILPGIGTAVGAAAGAVLGVFGFGGRAEAAKWWDKSGKPQLDSISQGFNAGSEPYMSAYSDLQNLDISADKATNKMGPGGHDYYNDTIKKAIQEEEAQMTREARAGRGQVTMSAAQFHMGGPISDFGDLATSDTEGFIHAMAGEYVMHPQATAANAPLLSAMNSGLDLPRMLQEQTKMRTHNAYDIDLHFNSPDAKGARDLLFANKHVIRAALNDSYSEYSGSSDFE